MKLDAGKVRELLAVQERPVAWLAKKIGVSNQVLYYQLKKERDKYAKGIARTLNVKVRDIINN